ncbi:peptidoglycan DD-metalloendopeptidase family protein [Virgibacillus necropolis]|uniref:peptidoglycan DD-metalloendopeptidase family protein n=1 Tax=Virgibacillus necropolis TaxID=163877 RepID=UPI00384F98A1
MFNRNYTKMQGRRRHLSILNKVVLLTCLAFSLIFTTTVLAASNELGIVYHVYMNGKHIGKVDDRSVVQDKIDAKIATGEEQFNKYTIAIGEKVSLIPEKVFNPTYNNEKVAKTLENGLSIKAKAVELKIADKTVGYFNNKKIVQEVLKAYKAKYVSEDILNKIEAKDETKKNEPKQDETSLSKGDSTVTEVTLSEKVTMEEKKTSPQDVLTVKQGVKMIEKGTLEVKKHKVEQGEVLGQIASKYDLSTKKLLELNSSLTEDSILQIGEELNVMEYAPFVNVIVKKEKLVEETIKHETKIIESDDLYKGEEKTKQDGTDGKREVHYAIEMTNGQQTAKEVITETVTKEPVKDIIIKGTKVISSRGTGNLHWPTIGGYVSSDVGQRWGRMHKGMDIARPSNRAILAADNGVVVEAGRDGSFGNKIVIDHNNGMRTIYAHLSSIGVQTGQTVKRGSQIGVMGTTGNSTGVHLHFEVHVNGSLERPASYF